MPASLKEKATTGVFWKTAERAVGQVVHFGVGILMARLLSPSDYGVVGMLAIFFALAGAFQDCGIGRALVQKQDRTQEDFSTAFYSNLGISLVVYIILFLSAPYIADFYGIPILKDVTRVSALSFIFNGLTSVQYAKMDIELKFKKRSILSIIGIAISGLTGILLAYNGMGVWALVFQGLVSSLLTGIILWVISGWKPSFTFSLTSFGHLFKFGGNLLASNIINTIYNNLYTLVIGKMFSPSMVGLYNRANGYARLPVSIVLDMATGVNFPILAKLQDDTPRLINAYKKLLSVPFYLLYPILTYLLVMADSIIVFLIGEKWLPCVPFLRILCVCYMFLPLNSVNLNLLYVKGRSDLALKLEFVKKPLGFLILFASIPLGIIWMMVGRTLYSICVFGINCFYTKKILNFGFIEQTKIIAPIMLNSALMGGCCYVATIWISSVFLKIFLGLVVSVFIYWLISIVRKDSNYVEVKDIIIERLKKSRHHSV